MDLMVHIRVDHATPQRHSRAARSTPLIQRQARQYNQICAEADLECWNFGHYRRRDTA